MPEEPVQPKYVPKPDGADPLATRLVAELKHDRGILACKYDPANQFLFAGARDYFVHRWDLGKAPVLEPPADPKKKPRYPPVPAAPADSRLEMVKHQSWVGGMALFSDGDRMATGDFVGQLVIWSGRATEPKPQFSFEAHKGSIRKVAVSPDGKLVASVGNDGAVRVWHTDAAEKLHLELLGHECHVYHVAFHPDGKSLISADLKGLVKHWNIESGKLVREIDASLLHTYSVKYEVDVGGIRGMTFNADGSQLACAGATGEDKGIAHSGDARVLLFDWETGKLLKELRAEKKEVCTAWGVQFHPDGFIIGSGGSRTGGFLWFWKPDDEVAFHVLKFRQRAPGFDVDLAPDNKTLAVADHDGTVRLYEMAAEPKPEPAPEEPKAKA
jgi:WD40 repeat protein